MMTDSSLLIPVRDLIRRAPVAVGETVSIRQAVDTMAAHDCSCVPVVDTERRPVGIFTDRDLRNRVVAAGVGIVEPLAAVMTREPVVVSAESKALEALLTLARHNIHHLPIVENDALIGVITATDLLRMRADSPLFIVSDIWKQETVEGLVTVSKRLPLPVRNLISADARAGEIGRFVSVFTDALTERLLQLAETQLGDPPVPYAWLAFGSQARQEQTTHSDQDNGLLLADQFEPHHDLYFAELATFVSDGLHRCGFVRCPGEVMATNPRWRQPLRVWRSYFQSWTTVTDPEAILNATIFFDIRHIAGVADLTDFLHREMVRLCVGNNRLLANLTKVAMGFQPPLGFFGRIQPIKNGEHQNKINLKHRGTVPVIDMVRIYALAHGIPAVNTFDRITQLIPTEAFVEADGRSLADTMEYIAYVRLQHQGLQLGQGDSADNYLNPADLSPFDHDRLQAAFQVVRKMQNTLARRYQIP